MEQKIRLPAANVYHLGLLLVPPCSGHEQGPPGEVHGGEEISREGKFKRGAPGKNPVGSELEQLLSVNVGEGKGDFTVKLHIG
jgi:hypothetical protein